MQLDANTTWFNLAIEGGPPFAVYAFSGTEEISAPYGFSIELVYRSSSVDLIGLIGKNACLSIADRSGGKRLVHGVIREMQQLHTANTRTHFRCSLVPRLWFLGQTSDHRIFQNKSVIDIIKQLLTEQGFAGDAFSFKCFNTYEPREYCVQYAESDLHFISRLCEEEGIYFYFEHSADKHCVCFADIPGGPPIAGMSNLRFFAGSGQVSDTAVIARLNLFHSANSNKATHREWNFEKAKLDLEVTKDMKDPKKAPVPPGLDLDVYQYPHQYQIKSPGKRYVDLQLLRQLTFHTWITGQSDISRFLPGHSFTVNSHPRPDVNSGWWVTAVMHAGQQPQVLEQEAPDRGMFYNSDFTAIPDTTRYVPPLAHNKVLIVGQQAAIVTGPANQEIYPDSHGRVKVQFFWDREGQWDEKTTCWIRVAQGWGGGQYGTMAIPRVGHEVLVSFLEGDPDRPIITGRVYHELNQPPYALPDNKTRTVFKTYSSPGGAGFNELRIEDKKGEEEIFIHAERDVNAYVKQDWSDMICANSHRHTGGSSFTRTSGETHRILEKNRVTLLGEGDYRQISKDSVSEVGANLFLRSSKQTQIEATTNILVIGNEGITIVCGKSSIIMRPESIHIDSTDIWLNCGGGDPVPLATYQIPELKLPKGAQPSNVPNGGEMAKPMSPKGKEQKSAGKGSPPPEQPDSMGSPAPAAGPAGPGGMGQGIVAGDNPMATSGLGSGTPGIMPPGGMGNGIVAGDNVMMPGGGMPEMPGDVFGEAGGTLMAAATQAELARGDSATAYHALQTEYNTLDRELLKLTNKSQKSSADKIRIQTIKTRQMDILRDMSELAKGI